MLFIDNQGHTKPQINLALEEYAVRFLPRDHDYFLFYINEPSIIIGKNQNAFEEINREYVETKGIHVVRRLSGGGAVYHDLGNLNFSFITDNDSRAFMNFRRFLEPIVRALREMGVEAEITGRNDIQVGGRKISGNAQYATKDRMFTHGTLLFDTDLEEVTRALRVSEKKMAAKGVKSVRSRVANISEFLKEKISMEEFKKRLLLAIFQQEEIPQYHLSQEDWERIYQLAQERYHNWEWNFGRSPEFNLQHTERIEGVGTLDIRLLVNKGVINEAHIYGDFFGTGEKEELERLLVGLKYDKEEIRKTLEKIDIGYYISGLNIEDFLKLLF